MYRRFEKYHSLSKRLQLYNSTSRNVAETVFSVSPHVYVSNCVRLLKIVTGRQAAVSKAYQATVDLVNASVQVTRQGSSEAIGHTM
jgi:hypothetical protein